MTDIPQQRALVIMAHGSRRAAANEEFFNLVKRIGEANADYHTVKPALLEQAPPTLLEACKALPAGVTHIDVYPLFFNQGRHVEKDIPAQVAEVIEALPDKHVTLLEYFGQTQDLAALVVSHIAQQTNG